MPENILAKSAGCCFGVNRAVNMCEQLLAAGKKICTLGPIIHNDYVVEGLAQKGCAAVADPMDTPQGHGLVIRSHGVAQSVYDLCARQGIELIDATCPFVAKIHDIVREHSARGCVVLVAGDKNHPEVQGIVGHCVGEVKVFSDFDELKAISDGIILSKPCIMVAQTTFNLVKYNEYASWAKKIYTNLLIFDTICGATRTRQQEAEDLARRCDVCVVIGGKNSSNTRKLSDVCARYAKTFSIESKDELTKAMLEGAKTVGVTAGASNPSPLIEEVLIKMSEMIKDEEFDFEQALDCLLYTSRCV